MFDFSFGELLVVVVAALVFIGPKELPVVIRALAGAMKAIRGLAQDVGKMFEELARETGVQDIKETLEKDITLIQGDDGNMYESYDVSKVKLSASTIIEDKKV
ncbi:MAG: twin-arginine translocase subunit TatB [Alphaproteobacteria bacterium]|nr:twin-arginine translocase subunit TatB [Alphaproteobacteria bacterium]